MEKVVVTGGAGFIGSHLAEELARRGYQVIILDDLSTGKMENIKPLLENENSVKFIQGSVTDLPLLQKLFQGVDYMFHHAAVPSVPQSIENPLATHEVNITGTLNVLLAARDCGVKKVVYASSSSIYGNTPTLPQREDMPPNPQSPYAVTKLAAANITARYSTRSTGFPPSASGISMSTDPGKTLTPSMLPSSLASSRGLLLESPLSSSAMANRPGTSPFSGMLLRQISHPLKVAPSAYSILPEARVSP